MSKKTKLGQGLIKGLKEVAEPPPVPIYQRIAAIQKLETGLNIPWTVTSAGFKVTLFGSQICFTDDGDYLTLEQARTLAEWLASELGGSVKWRRE